MIYFFKVVCVSFCLKIVNEEKRIIEKEGRKKIKERKETTPLSWWSVLECGREELLYCGEEMIGNVLLLFFAGVEVWRCVVLCEGPSRDDG